MLETFVVFFQIEAVDSRGPTTLTMVKTRSFCFMLLQLAAFCGLFWVCNWVATTLHWKIPGSVIGLAILVFLLLTRIVPESAVRAGSGWLIGELLLFFIPPVVSVLKYQVMIREDGGMVLATVLGGTIMVMIGTANVVDRVYRWEKRMNEKRDQNAANKGEHSHV